MLIQQFKQSKAEILFALHLEEELRQLVFRADTTTTSFLRRRRGTDLGSTDSVK